MSSITTLKAACAAFAKSEVLAGNAVEFIARELGTAPDYSKWETMRKAFVAEYASARKCDEKAAGEAWLRLARRAGEMFGVTKPKAPSAAAGRASANRTKHAERVDALIAQHKTVAGLKTAASAATSPAEVKAIADAMVKVDRAAQSAAKDAAKAARDAMIERVRKMKPEHLAMLVKAADLIEAGKAVKF